MWKVPKSDWKESNFFNIEDYNRIKDNLNEIKIEAFKLWKPFLFENMGADKTYQDYSFYADEINKFENNIEHICNNTFLFTVGDKKIFYDNQPFIDYIELNRIENACLTIYENIMGRKKGMKRLALRLNGGDF